MRGGAIFIFDNINIQIDQSQFEYNDADITGSCMFIKNEGRSIVEIRKTEFKYNTNQCIKLYKSQDTSISIIDSLFMNNSIYSLNDTKGAALNLHEYLSVSIRNSRFESNVAL